MSDRKPSKAMMGYINRTPPGTCEFCAVDHQPENAHNCQSLHYQYQFYFRYQRWPTWADAIAHCDEPIKQLWQTVLKEKKDWSEHPDPIPQLRGMSGKQEAILTAATQE